jgi:hypothetical protein
MIDLMEMLEEKVETSVDISIKQKGNLVYYIRLTTSSLGKTQEIFDHIMELAKRKSYNVKERRL